MSILGKTTKQPREEKFLDIDLSGDLLPDDFVSGSNVVSVTCEEVPLDLSLVVIVSMTTTMAIRLFVTGGLHDHRYKVTTLTETGNGEKLEDELIIRVLEV